MVCRRAAVLKLLVVHILERTLAPAERTRRTEAQDAQCSVQRLARHLVEFYVRVCVLLEALRVHPVATCQDYLVVFRGERSLFRCAQAPRALLCNAPAQDAPIPPAAAV